jgi:hypothetical protein
MTLAESEWVVIKEFRKPSATSYCEYITLEARNPPLSDRL